MVFVPPNLDTFKNNVKSLDGRFSILMNRYQVQPTPQNTNLGVSTQTQKQSSLEILIARINVLGSTPTARRAQLDVLIQLVNELRPIQQSSSDQEAKQAALFLLGALFHRYFRLIDEYALPKKIAKKIPILSLLSSIVDTVVEKDVRDCRLFLSIRNALQLPTFQASKTCRENLENDLKILDPLTVLKALECFQTNMLTTVTDTGTARYRQYPHLEQDENFEVHLQKIINKQRQRAEALIEQFSAIEFIQSLVKVLSREQESIEQAVDLWSSLVAREHPSFSDTKLDAIDTHLQGNMSEPFKSKVAIFLNSEYIENQLPTMSSFAELAAALKKCNADFFSYALTGACSLVLYSINNKLSKKGEMIGARKEGFEKLQHSIHQTLNLTDPKEFTEQMQQTGEDFLNKYIEDHPDVVLETAFFGGEQSFKSLLATRSMEYAQKQIHDDSAHEFSVKSSL